MGGALKSIYLNQCGLSFQEAFSSPFSLSGYNGLHGTQEHPGTQKQCEDFRWIPNCVFINTIYTNCVFIKTCTF